MAKTPRIVTLLPNIIKLTSGSGTYTPSTGTKWIRVRMVGGGGSTAPTPGNNTTFGTSLLVANGGAAGNGTTGNTSGGAGGSASLGTGPVGIAVNGGGGGAGTGAAGQTNLFSGGGGGAGGYVDAIITSLLSSYSYSVGTGGTG